MRLAVISFLLVVSFQGQTTDSNCPTIKVTGPDGITNPTETLEFTVALSNKPADIKYFWKVSGGSVQSGHGTPSIVVRTSLADSGQSIEATINIDGLPTGCPNFASETATVARVTNVHPDDEWGRLPNNQQKLRLDSFFWVLANNPDQDGIIFISTKMNEGRLAPLRQMAFILNHAKFRKFDKNRLVFALTELDRHQTVLWRYPPDQVKDLCKSPCKLIYGRDLK